MSRVNKLRLGAAMIGVTATALLAAAIPANAEAASGTLPSTDGVSGYKVHLDKGSDYDTKLFNLQVGGKTLLTYCVDIHTEIKAGSEYVEVPWDKHPKEGSSFNKNAGKISWILQNSYPQVADLKAIEKAVAGEEFDKGISEKEAITATQVAIWHFSDGVNLNKDNPVNGALAKGDDTKDIVKLYSYLIAKAQDLKGAPKPELNLEPNKLSGKPGDKIGPFVVTTTAQGVKVEALLPEGVTLTDKDGKSLDQAAVAARIQALDKYEFYVQVPANAKPDKVEFTVSGTTTFTLGRLFISKDVKNKPSQSLILAKTDSVPLSTKGTAAWNNDGTTPPTSETPVPQAKPADDALANTGASILMPIVIGVVLVGAGVGALVFQRRRRA